MIKLPPRVKDLTGLRFGKLVVLGFVGTARKRSRWKTKCDCGKEHEVASNDLKSGHTVSCGCWRVGKTHGLTKRGKNHPIYNTWIGMKSRCLNPNQKHYPSYGGRGITICKRWLEFENFLADMGSTWKPGLSIHRIKDALVYCKEKCKWATDKEQANDKRPRKKSEIH